MKPKIITVILVLIFFVLKLQAQIQRSCKCIAGEALVSSVDNYFIGGEKAFKQFIKKNTSLKHKYKLGRKNFVTLLISLDKTGNLLTVNIQDRLQTCEECNQEAIRLIQLVKKWKPYCRIETQNKSKNTKVKKCSSYKFTVEVPFSSL